MIDDMDENTAAQLSFLKSEIESRFKGDNRPPVEIYFDEAIGQYAVELQIANRFYGIHITRDEVDCIFRLKPTLSLDTLASSIERKWNSSLTK